jgi:hypothetical protein
MTICDRLLLCGSWPCTSSNNATPLVYLVRLSTISTTFVTKVMGSTGDVELNLRAALTSAPLSDAALGDVITNVLSIITDAIEPGGLMGMTISSSHTSLQATTNGAVKAIFEITTPKRAETAGDFDGMGLPYDNTATPVRAAAADQTTEIPGLMSPQQRARWDAAESGSDQTTLTAVAVEMMRAGIAAGIHEGAAPEVRNADGSESTGRGIFDELQSPAYGPLLKATQNMVHEAQDEATSVLLHQVKDTISLVLSRVFQVIEPVIQTCNTSTGAVTQSYTIMLRDSKSSFAQYFAERMAVSDAAAQMQLTYDRQIEHNQTLVAKFSEIMRVIGDLNSIKYTPGVQGDGSTRTPGWGSYTDGQASEATHNLSEYVKLKAALRGEMEETALDLKSQADCLATYNASKIAVMVKHDVDGSPDLREKSINTAKPSDFTGDLTVAMMTDQDSPVSAQLLHTFVQTVCLAFPGVLGAAHPYIRRIFVESCAGKAKTVPPSLLNETRKPGTLAALGMSPAFILEYKSANSALYNFLGRIFEAAMRGTQRPHKIFGTDTAESIVQSCQGDAVMALFIIIDRMEKHGWNDRNAKREFYSHIDILLASEPSLKRAIALIRMPMVEAKRLNTVLDYEVFKRFCTTLLRRESAVLSSTVSKYADITRDPTDPEYEENLIELLDELLAEVAALLDEFDIDQVPVVTSGVHHVEMQMKAEAYAALVLPNGWQKTNAGTGTGSDGGGAPKGGGFRGQPWTAPAGYSGPIVCAHKQCNKKIESHGADGKMWNLWKVCVKYMVSKGRPIDSEEHTLLCGPCYQSLFKGTVQALPCALGKLVKIPRDDGKGFVIRLKDGESASANLVDAEKPKAQLAIEDVQNNVPAPAPAPAAASSFSGFGTAGSSSSSTSDFFEQMGGMSMEQTAALFAAVDRRRAYIDDM